jgi:hypothetical protein
VRPQQELEKKRNNQNQRSKIKKTKAKRHTEHKKKDREKIEGDIKDSNSNVILISLLKIKSRISLRNQKSSLFYDCLDLGLIQTPNFLFFNFLVSSKSLSHFISSLLARHHRHPHICETLYFIATNFYDQTSSIRPDRLTIVSILKSLNFFWIFLITFDFLI